jgi:catechol 2,3-dioxygenase-like lactoylglutathione lyase family enzyme
MSTFTRTHFVLAVPNLQTSADFYHSVLGFTVKEMGPGWLFFERDNCRIMVGECPQAISPKDLGDHSYYGYVVATEIDELYASVQAHRAEVIKTLRDEPWGMREFGVRTSDGHRLMFGSALNQASSATSPTPPAAP